MLRKLFANATGKKVVISFAVYVGFTVLFQVINAQMQAHFGGVSPLDFHTSYTADEAYSVLAGYGDTGRAWHTAINIVDFLYIASYTLFFGMFMAYALNKAGYAQSKLRFVVAFPFLMGLVDVLENICILVLIAFYPTQLASVASAAGLLTQLKFMMASVNLALVAVVLIVFGWAKVVKKR